MASGDEIEAGRTTTAESTTFLIGAVPSEQNVNFNGSVILHVGPQRGDLRPRGTLSGILGIGYNRPTPPGNPGGVGVIGQGGHNQGTGVLGVGGGESTIDDESDGGIGVHGIGGSHDGSNDRATNRDRTNPPGIGVVGQGGMQEGDALRRPHGAGIVGVAGGARKPLPSYADTGGVGVYGQGAEAKVTTEDLAGHPDVVRGPMEPGPGVLGRGGITIPLDDNLVAAGVIGLAGDVAIPPFGETINTGVYGRGYIGVSGEGVSSGVRGVSKQGEGVFGRTESQSGVFGSAIGDTGRGGAFQTARSAQIWLVPQRQPVDFSTPVPVTPTAIPTIEGESVWPELPKDGRSGDLMAIADSQGCTLWFCVRGEGGLGPARWAQVLLGPSVEGQA